MFFMVFITSSSYINNPGHASHRHAMSRKRPLADTERPPLDWEAEGCLVAFPAVGGQRMRMLDGFYRSGPGTGAPLLVFVHGMGSNFYRSALKKAFIEVAPALGMGILSFNNRGRNAGRKPNASAPVCMTWMRRPSLPAAGGTAGSCWWVTAPAARKSRTGSPGAGILRWPGWCCWRRPTITR
jgi:hypothetical protein